MSFEVDADAFDAGHGVDVYPYDLEAGGWRLDARATVSDSGAGLFHADGPVGSSESAVDSRAPIVGRREGEGRNEAGAELVARFEHESSV